MLFSSWEVGEDEEAFGMVGDMRVTLVALQEGLGDLGEGSAAVEEQVEVGENWEFLRLIRGGQR